MNVHSQSNSDSTGKALLSALIPIEADGFHAFVDTFALDGQWVVFLSIAGHKDAVRAIRARLLTNHWVNVGVHEICLLPKTKYGTIVKALPSGIVHTAIFIKNDAAQSLSCYALTASLETADLDLYFANLIKHSAVPVHANWKAWLYKRAIQKQEVGPLTAHGIHGVKVILDDETLAVDISAALKKGKLRHVIDNDSLLPFPKISSRI